MMANKALKLFGIVGICFLSSLLLFINCKKTPTTPDPVVEYHVLLQVWYTEDPADLSFPIVPNAAGLNYEIYDPNPQYPLIKENHEYTSSSYRCGRIYLTQIGEYQYTGYIPNVRIQNSQYDGKHVVRVVDGNLKGEDRITAKGIVVNKSKDLEVAGWDLRFNVSR
jgi:hypothetical protein